MKSILRGTLPRAGPFYIKRGIAKSHRGHNEISSFKTAVETAEKLVQPKSDKFSDPFSIVSHEMSNLAKSIASLIGSGHPTLNRVSSYYFEAEGKNVRPLIVLLLSKALLKIPESERTRIDIDDQDVTEQPHYKGTPTKTSVAGNTVDDLISPLAVLHGINPRVILDPLSKPMDQLPQIDAINGILPKQRRLAEIVEMIHTASLLHDDVIDLSDARRGRPSGNIAFTNKMAVLAGDFLLGRASVAIARLRNPEVIELLSTTIANLVEGEFMQLKNTVMSTEPTINNDGDAKTVPEATGKVPTVLHEYSVATPKSVDHATNVDAAFEYYLHKTYLKTASLMSKLSRAAAVLSGAQDDVVENCYQFGRNLGLCFQIVDDMLDYTSSDDAIGKPSQADLKLGLATAPILFAWRERPELGELIARKFKEDGDVEIARRAVQQFDGVEKTRQMAREYCHRALENLSVLPPSDARSALELLTNSVLTRSK
ncbi:hexaprenyl pyrophosphate synthetase mitochondrial precursor [Suhomyces tanzawaensis NRRL Y-17324]|uniref:Hexaprenyl pyrophosphate synthetase mitochondrial n=1 Tax=Suhomyces tanzawaensis NRRL Y-17324 TaxID=984487 RepID=A0A1E4SF64_9ASCO|nr:hexaprenyl pyrophosphate synthetase mitochondrial precursor [Suhomyces tanzawaensis NRRL Y-17324]ODV78169.1 hexaprenyl pyrophosphate synthetase mitochondrial precursor [Suhomyces tanzawaensis NRRL Y-17324]